MERKFTVSNHPTLTGVKRKVIYDKLLDNAKEEVATVFFTIKYETENGESIKGMPSQEDFIMATNARKVLEDGTLSEDGTIGQYNYFLSLIDTESPTNLFSVIEYWIVKTFDEGIFD